MRFPPLLLVLFFLSSLSPVFGQLAGASSSVDDSGIYLKVVQKSADALLNHGRDSYGPRHSGQILSLLNRKDGKPLGRLPEGPAGIRRDDRPVPYGSNANLQMELYRTLRHLTRLTGDPRYSEAADRGLEDFLEITQHPETGFLAWGEHLCWNCLDEKPDSNTFHPDTKKQQLIHEPKRKFIYFDELYQAHPVATLKYARGLWEHQIADPQTGDFSRHAKYDGHDPRKGFDFPKEGSYFICTWSEAYTKSRDAVFDRAIQVLATRYLKRTNPLGLLDNDSTPMPERQNLCVTLWSISLAMECHDAIPRLDDADTRVLLQQLAEKMDRGFLSLQHEVSDPQKGFICYAYTDTGKPRPREEKKSEGYSRCWEMGYGVNVTSMFGLLSHARQAQLGATPEGDAYRRWVVEAARVYQTAPRHPEQQDLWSGEYGMAIFLELAAFRLTREPAFLATARAMADEAIRTFWDKGSALPRASSRTDFYEVTAYPDTLIAALLALHEHVNNLPPTVEISDLCR